MRDSHQRPHELAVGGLGVVARLAVIRKEKFWGLGHVALDLPTILAEAGVIAQSNLQLALRDGRGRVFFGKATVFDSNPVLHRIDLPDGHWDLGAIPIDGWSGAIRRDLAIFDSGALASALLLSVIIYLLSFRDARLALRVGEGTRALTSELQHRTTVESELRAARSRYQSLVDVNPEAMLVNFNKKIVYANDAAARLLGAAAPEDLLGRSPLELVEPERRAEVERRYERQWPRASPTGRVLNAGCVSTVRLSMPRPSPRRCRGWWHSGPSDHARRHRTAARRSLGAQSDRNHPRRGGVHRSAGADRSVQSCGAANLRLSARRGCRSESQHAHAGTLHLGA